MNVLMLTAYPPVLDMHGGGVRMYHNIRILSERHRVRVISFVESEEERERLASVREICESVVAIQRVPDYRPHWLSTRPFLIREFGTPAMYSAVDAAFRSERVDVLQCEYLQMAQFRRPGTFSILTAIEAVSKNAWEDFSVQQDPLTKFRLFYRWMQMLHYEIPVTRKFDRVVTMTPEDAAYLSSYSPSANIRPISIGVDSEYFHPLPEEAERPLEVLFVGNFRHTPNVEAVSFLIRHVAPRFPGIQFIFPGKNVPSELVGGSNVSFPGYVPEIRTLYSRPNTIVLAPLFSGTGQRVKLLEAFSMGCPVVTTGVGAMGFPIRSGEEAILANTPDEFVDALRLLVESIEYRRKLGVQARRMIEEKFGWPRLAEEFLGVIEEAAVSD
jgi:glycosyltransferase involved in cell wall biosynthesis